VRLKLHRTRHQPGDHPDACDSLAERKIFTPPRGIAAAAGPAALPTQHVNHQSSRVQVPTDDPWVGGLIFAKGRLLADLLGQFTKVRAGAPDSPLPTYRYPPLGGANPLKFQEI
jgi:hypothetical protein